MYKRETRPAAEQNPCCPAVAEVAEAATARPHKGLPGPSDCLGDPQGTAPPVSTEQGG